MAEVELGTYFLSDKMRDKWFERHWFLGGNKGSAYVDGFFPEGKICRTSQLLTNVGGKRTMTAAGPTRSFGSPPEGRIVTEELPKVDTRHEQYFENYKKAYRGEEEFFDLCGEICVKELSQDSFSPPPLGGGGKKAVRFTKKPPPHRGGGSS